MICFLFAVFLLKMYGTISLTFRPTVLYKNTFWGVDSDILPLDYSASVLCTESGKL
jgi:hypothetical protein